MPSDDTNQTADQLSSIAPVAQLVVTGLFGHREPITVATNFANSNLAIFYGENGVGKTTLLRILYYLLAPEPNRGHRTNLFKLPFKTAKVILSDGTEIEALRSENGEPPHYVKLQSDKKSYSVAYVSNGAGGVMALDTETLAAMTRRVPAVFFLPDDRRIHKPEAVPGMLSRFVESEGSHVDRSDLETAIHEVNREIERSMWASNRKSEQSVHSVYKQIITTLAQTPSSKYFDDDVATRLTEISDRTKQFSRFGLTSRVNLSSLFRPLEDSPPETTSLALQILQPYVDGLQKKLDALSPLYESLSKMIIHLNTFFSDKTIDYTFKKGLVVISKKTEEPLDVNVLSSGEKQILLLFCKVFLSRKRPSLVLIDEPELSLNVIWQRHLLKDLLDCMSSTHAKLLIASHSPDLIGEYLENVVRISHD